MWTFALTLLELLERAGAYLGLVAFFGLALLTVLYFAQARELKRLRDWAGTAPEQAREEDLASEAAARLREGSHAAETPRRVPDAAAVTAREQRAPAALAATAPARSPDEPPTQVHSAVPGAGAAVAGSSHAGDPGPAGNGASDNGTTGDSGPTPAQDPEGSQSRPWQGRRRELTTTAVIALIAVLALGGGAYALSSMNGDGTSGNPFSAADSGEEAAQPEQTPDPAATRSATTVAVLNGTTTTGLAGRLADQLTEAGYLEGPRGNNADQQRETSVVLYEEGFEQQALDVGRLLEISDVQVLDSQVEAELAGDAEVVVIAGHDQAP